jgi:holo-[acyl-carrier protein] synthase
MIYGIGIDLVNIKRLERTMERWGDRFVNRVFTPDERKFCYKRAYPASAFALRFAAKEAFSKAREELGGGTSRYSIILVVSPI